MLYYSNKSKLQLYQTIRMNLTNIMLDVHKRIRRLVLSEKEKINIIIHYVRRHGCLGWQRVGAWRMNKGASRTLVIFCFLIWVPVTSVDENSVYEKSSPL